MALPRTQIKWRKHSINTQTYSLNEQAGTARISKTYDRLFEEHREPRSRGLKLLRKTAPASTGKGLSQIEMTDEELMLAVCMGDKLAYQTLVKQHLKPISHYAYRLLGNQKDTEDIAQEVFLRLWINAAKWKTEKAKLSTWLHRITHNLCIDYLRRHGRVQTQDTFDEKLTHLSANEHNNSEEEVDQLKRLNTAIGNLPESQRSALVLCHYQGFSNKEAAAIMNISVKALESAIARAKRALRDQLSTAIQQEEAKQGQEPR